MAVPRSSSPTVNLFGTDYSASLIASLLPPKSAPIIGTVVTPAAPGTPQITPGSSSTVAAAHPLVGLPMPHSVGANYLPLGPAGVALLSGNALQHFSKALSAVLRGDFKYGWADQAVVLHRIRSSRRWGDLTESNLQQVLLGNRRFKARILDGTPQLRASERGR